MNQQHVLAISVFVALLVGFLIAFFLFRCEKIDAFDVNKCPSEVMECVEIVLPKDDYPNNEILKQKARMLNDLSQKVIDFIRMLKSNAKNIPPEALSPSFYNASSVSIFKNSSNNPPLAYIDVYRRDSTGNLPNMPSYTIVNKALINAFKSSTIPSRTMSILNDNTRIMSVFLDQKIKTNEEALKRVQIVAQQFVR